MKIKEKLYLAIKELLYINAIEDITVADILNKSKVSRSSFYRNFKDKYDLINSYYQQYFDKLFKSDQEEMGFAQIYLQMVKFMDENRLFFVKAYKVRGQNSWQQFAMKHAYQYCEREYKRLKGVEALLKEEQDMIYYYISGCLYLTNRWMIEDEGISAEKLTELSLEFMPEKLKKYLQ